MVEVDLRRKMRYALRWCHLNPVPKDGSAATAGDGLSSRNGSVCDSHIAGPGTPLVAAGAPAELGAAWGVSTQSAIGRMGWSWSCSTGCR